MGNHDDRDDRDHCEQCGRLQPRRSRWRRLCASCIKQQQGREMNPPQRPTK